MIKARREEAKEGSIIDHGMVVNGGFKKV